MVLIETCVRQRQIWGVINLIHVISFVSDEPMKNGPHPSSGNETNLFFFQPRIRIIWMKASSILIKLNWALCGVIDCGDNFARYTKRIIDFSWKCVLNASKI